MQQKKVLVIAGPTGVGESAITNKIIKQYPIFKRLITATTRKPRLKEKNQVDYYFFTKSQFQQEIKNGNIPEYTYVKNRDVYYGSYKPNLDKKIKQNFNVIMNPDIIGAKYYKKHFGATTIFITPDSIENLKKRHLARNPSLSKNELKKRMDCAKYEIKNESSFYDYIVKNKQGKLKDAVDEVKKIIKKENYRLRKTKIDKL